MAIVKAFNFNSVTSTIQFQQLHQNDGVIYCTGSIVADNSISWLKNYYYFDVCSLVYEMPTPTTIAGVKGLFYAQTVFYFAPMIGFLDSSGTVLAQIAFSTSSDGTISAYNSSGMAIGKSTGKVPWNVPFNLEAELNETSGTMKVWLNGDTSNPLLTISGISILKPIARIRVGGNTDSRSRLYDLIVRSGDTSPIGNQYVMTLRPAATVSKSNDVTTTTGADPAAVLAATAPGGASVQLPSADDAVKLSFGHLDPTVTDVSAVCVTADLSKSGAGDGSARLDVTVGGTTTQGASVALANGFAGQTTLSGAELSVAAVNGMTATITRTA